MTTYVYRNGEIVPKESGHGSTGGIMPDIKPFVTQDGVAITSRSHLRAYEQANGVRQVGNDFASDVARMKEKINGRLG